MTLLNSVKFLDVSNNSISKIEDSLAGLKSLKNLTHLSIDIDFEDDKRAIAKNCAKLEFLNGEEVVHEECDDDPEQSTPAPAVEEKEEKEPIRLLPKKLSGDDIREIEAIYEDIKGLHREKDIGLDKDLAEAFSNKVQFL